ncbi:MAG: N-acetylneuraminate synthase family protein [Phycisphaerales bacterium]
MHELPPDAEPIDTLRLDVATGTELAGERTPEAGASISPSITIAGQRITQHGSPLIIAEIGVNHDGDPDLAVALIDAAATAGADAIKLQIFEAERLTTRDTPTAAYQAAAAAGSSQREMLRRLQLPVPALPEIVSEARSRGLTVLATPFDPESVDLVRDLGVDAIKIGSGDLTHAPLLQHIAATGRPIICSTGMAAMADVQRAVAVITEAARVAASVPASAASNARGSGTGPGGDPGPGLALLHCVSAYPAPTHDANLRAIPAVHAATGCVVGWSDHCPGNETAVAAVALGAPIIERHLTLDRGAVGPDHAASDDPERFAAYVRAIRTAHAALGDGTKRATSSEDDVRHAARRSIVARQPIPAGTLIEPSMLDFRRPGTGLSPELADDVAGRITAVDIPAETLIHRDMLA